MKKLIAFYLRADENYVSGMLKALDVGNTEVAAIFKNCALQQLLKRVLPFAAAV